MHISFRNWKLLCSSFSLTPSQYSSVLSHMHSLSESHKTPQQYRNCSDTASGDQDMDESLSQSLFCTLRGRLDCLWSADTYLHCLNALVTGPFPSKEEPMAHNHCQALTLNGCCEEVAGPTSPHPVARDIPSLAGSRREGEGTIPIWPEEKGKCFLLWFPKGSSILAEATCLPGQSVLLRFLSKAIQANSGPITSSIQLNIFDLGFFSLFTLQGDYSDALSAPSSVPGSSMKCLSACSTVTRFPCCINHCSDQLPWVSS